MAARRATGWIAYDFEPPLPVTRVRSTDGGTVAIRGGWTGYQNESLWAYVMVDGKPRTPGPDPSQEDCAVVPTGWVLWLDLDFTGRCKWTDDTANDDRGTMAG